VEMQLLAFFTSTLEGVEWSASRPGRFKKILKLKVGELLFEDHKRVKLHRFN
jgi:hypothetical protein